MVRIGVREALSALAQTRGDVTGARKLLLIYDAKTDTFGSVRLEFEPAEALSYLQKIDIKKEEAVDFALGVMRELNPVTPPRFR